MIIRRTALTALLASSGLLLLAACTSAPAVTSGNPAPSAEPTQCGALTVGAAHATIDKHPADTITSIAAVTGIGGLTIPGGVRGSFITATTGSVTVNQFDQRGLYGTVQTTPDLTVTAQELVTAIQLSGLTTGVDGPLSSDNLGSAGFSFTTTVHGPTVITQTMTPVIVTFENATCTTRGPNAAIQATAITGTATLYTNGSIASWPCPPDPKAVTKSVTRDDGARITEWCHTLTH